MDSDLFTSRVTKVCPDCFICSIWHIGKIQHMARLSIELFLEKMSISVSVRESWPGNLQVQYGGF